MISHDLVDENFEGSRLFRQPSDRMDRSGASADAKSDRSDNNQDEECRFGLGGSVHACALSGCLAAPRLRLVYL